LSGRSAIRWEARSTQARRRSSAGSSLGISVSSDQEEATTVFALHHLLERATEVDPAKEAVRCDGRSLTYEELDRAANAVAGALIDGGVRRGDRVGLFLPKSVEAVAALYGVLKAGAAYVPMDPKAPVVRAATIAGDCTVSALVTTGERASPLLSELAPHRPHMILTVGDEQTAEPLDVPWVGYAEVTSNRHPARPPVSAIDTDLAYILYTSGSTGRPKGVMLTHRHALTFVEWCAEKIGTGPEDRFSNHAPFHFDLSVFDLYVAAHGGATVSVVPEATAYFGADLAAFIRHEGITVWYSVPSALMLLTRAAEPGSLPSLRAVVFAGEVYPTKHLRSLRSLVPDAALWNLYGPTETNVCTYYRVDDLADDDRPIPIGRACENTEVFALREDGQVAGVGEEGELYVRGSLVMKGYWGDPDRTAEVLVQNPLAPGVPEFVYRTGDLVRLRPDGDYDFFGRRDHQIKSRGYRIELGEIEASLHGHPRILEAVAVAVPHEEWGKAIVAFVVPRDGASITENEVKQHVSRRLPRYMVPARAEVVAELPRTSTGKADRTRLAEEASVKATS
jgi:amino acid adenylation domain-containing protein